MHVEARLWRERNIRFRAPTRPLGRSLTHNSTRLCALPYFRRLFSCPLSNALLGKRVEHASLTQRVFAGSSQEVSVSVWPPAQPIQQCKWAPTREGEKRKLDGIWKAVR